MRQYVQKEQLFLPIETRILIEVTVQLQHQDVKRRLQVQELSVRQESRRNQTEVLINQVVIVRLRQIFREAQRQA